MYKGGGVFIKVGTLVIKWDTILGHSYKRALGGPSSASQEWNPGAVAILVLCYSTAVVTH